MFNHLRRHGVRSLGVTTALVLALTACGTTAAQKPRDTAVDETSASSESISAPTRAWKTVVLGGLEPQTRVEVTVLDVATTVQSRDDLYQLPEGHRLVAVKLKIRNAGPSIYLDAPDSGALATDNHGNTHGSALVMSISSGRTFLETYVRLEPGESVEAWTVFAIPLNARLASVTFTTDSGEGKTGTWEL